MLFEFIFYSLELPIFRYASVLPQSQLLFCTIIQEFGKKKDLVSALSAFEAVKQKSGGFNMFVCRTVIDVCGICGDYMKSRALFKVWTLR